MTARTGMATLIARLRTMTDAGTADYSIAGTTYWTDAQVQTILDLYRTDFRREQLRRTSETVSGTANYLDYYSRHRDLEEATGGTVVWRVEEGDGDDLGTANYTVNYEAGHIRMNSTSGGTVYYLTGRSYNMRKAASDLWRRKAANAAKHYDFSADGHSFKRSQFAAHCLQMAEYYDRQGGVTVGVMSRSDLT